MSATQTVPVATDEMDDCCAGTPSGLMPLGRASGIAELFKALSDPTRVRVLAYVSASEEGTVCACHLPAELGISQPTLSHHLKKLTEAGLLAREQRGRWAHYTAVPDALGVARDFLSTRVEQARE